MICKAISHAPSVVSAKDWPGEVQIERAEVVYSFIANVRAAVGCRVFGFTANGSGCSGCSIGELLSKEEQSRIGIAGPCRQTKKPAMRDAVVKLYSRDLGRAYPLQSLSPFPAGVVVEIM